MTQASSPATATATGVLTTTPEKRTTAKARMRVMEESCIFELVEELICCVELNDEGGEVLFIRRFKLVCWRIRIVLVIRVFRGNDDVSPALIQDALR